jgi:hypothetical protein
MGVVFPAGQKGDAEILVAQQPPQGILACDHAGRLINKFSGCRLPAGQMEGALCASHLRETLFTAGQEGFDMLHIPLVKRDSRRSIPR